VPPLPPLSPTLKHIKINQIVTEWKEDEIKRISISRSKDIKDTFVHGQTSYSGGFRRCTTNFITKL